MRLINIPADKEPECLNKLNLNSNNTYDALRGCCKKKVKDTLVDLQYGLCAYCERKILKSGVKGVSEVHIEHYLAIVRGSGINNVSIELGWSNFLGVCSSKIWDTNTNSCKPSGIICSDARGETPLKIDPRNSHHIKTIYFDDLTICSHNAQLNSDLNFKLNLNCEALKRKRSRAFDDLDSLFVSESIENGILRDEFYRKTILTIRKDYPEFQSFLLAAFKKRMNYNNSLLFWIYKSFSYLFNLIGKKKHS